MSEVAPGWQPPEEPSSPAPGIEFGGFGARFLAYLIDTVILSVFIVAMFLVVGIGAAFGVNSAAGLAVEWIAIIVLVVGFVGYHPWFWARSGSTPGMRMRGLQVVRDRDGGKVGVGQAILRLLGYFVSAFVSYLGFIWILIDKRRRGWHDLIAGTVVIRRRP